MQRRRYASSEADVCVALVLFNMFMQVKYLLLTLLGLLLSSLPAQAHHPDSVTNIDEVLVTATQTPRSIKKLPVITQVISRQDIQRINPRSVADILEMSLPGVQISVHGAQYRLSVQGLSSEYMLILLDGERISSEGSGTIDLNRIDMASIERVEVMRGAASAIYGSNAIGGVINFITRRATQALEVTAGTEYGSEGVWRHSGSVGLRSGGLMSLTSIGRTSQDAYTITTTDNINGEMPGNKIWNLRQKLQYTAPDRKWDLRATGGYSRRDQTFDVRTSYVYDVYTASGQIARIFSERSSLNANYSFERYDRSTRFEKVQDKPLQPLFYLNTHTGRVQYNHGNDATDRLLFNVGAELLHEGLKGDRLLTAETRYAAHTISLYAQADWKALPSLTLSAGLREDIHSSFKGHLTPRVAALYSTGAWRFRFSYSEGLRSPSLKNMYMYWDHLGMFDIIGNTSLRPETSRMFSIAPEYQTKDLNWTFIASYNRIKDMIVLRSRTNDKGRIQQIYSNTDEHTELVTLQSNLRWLIARGLRLHLDAAWVYNTYRVKTSDGKRVSGTTTRPYNANATLSYERRLGDFMLSGNLSARYSSAVTIASYSAQEQRMLSDTLPGYSIMRLGVTSVWKHYLRATIGIDNLLNYRPHTVNFTGSLSPGRTYFASLHLTL